MAKMTGAQKLVRTLEELGVEYLFGYPGGAVIDIYDALYLRCPLPLREDQARASPPRARCRPYG